jgi:hypothetical protein
MQSQSARGIFVFTPYFHEPLPSYESIKTFSLVELKQVKLDLTQKKGFVKEKMSELVREIKAFPEISPDRDLMQEEITKYSKRNAHLGRLLQECDKAILMLKEKAKADQSIAENERKESFHRRFVAIAQIILSKDQFDLIVSSTLNAIESSQKSV